MKDLTHQAKWQKRVRPPAGKSEHTEQPLVARKAYPDSAESRADEGVRCDASVRVPFVLQAQRLVRIRESRSRGPEGGPRVPSVRGRLHAPVNSFVRDGD